MRRGAVGVGHEDLTVAGVEPSGSQAQVGGGQRGLGGVIELRGRQAGLDRAERQQHQLIGLVLKPHTPAQIESLAEGSQQGWQAPRPAHDQQPLRAHDDPALIAAQARVSWCLTQTQREKV
jgi:hypothetical protein